MGQSETCRTSTSGATWGQVQSSRAQWNQNTAGQWGWMHISQINDCGKTCYQKILEILWRVSWWWYRPKHNMVWVWRMASIKFLPQCHCLPSEGLQMKNQGCQTGFLLGWSSAEISIFCLFCWIQLMKALLIIECVFNGAKCCGLEGTQFDTQTIPCKKRENFTYFSAI